VKASNASWKLHENECANQHMRTVAYSVHFALCQSLGCSLGNKVSVNHWYKDKSAPKSCAIDVVVDLLKEVYFHLAQAGKTVIFVGAAFIGVLVIAKNQT
jgi:hypothetical protein